MRKRDLVTALAKRPVLCDGGMGTQLITAGLPPGACGALWNIEQPDAILAIHRRYRDAGCELLTTNTFQASRRALEMHGLAERAAELNRAAAELTRRAAGDEALVLADVGPFGGFLEPFGETTPDELRDIFAEQLAALREGGADAVIVETMSDPNELRVAVEAAKQIGDWPVIGSYAFERQDGETFRTMMGVTVAEAVAAAIDAGADIVGANCGSSLDLSDYERLAAQLVAAARSGCLGQMPQPRTPAVILQPNAGSPRLVDGQTIYPSTPQDMAAIVPNLLEIGVRILGGCCGTTPDHLHAMSESLHHTRHAADA